MAQALADGSTSPQSSGRESKHTARSIPGWARRYLVIAVATDAVSVLVAGAVAQYVRFGGSDPSISSGSLRVPYFYVAALLVPVWLGVMALNGCYDYRLFGAGLDEYQGVLTAGIQFFAAIAIVDFLLKLDVARGFVVIAIPIAFLMSVVSRWLLRKWLQRSRASGSCLQRVLIIGTSAPVEQVERQLNRAPWTGFELVATYTTEHGAWHAVGDASLLPVVNDVCDLAGTLEALDIDALVVANGNAFAPGELRRLSWSLEDSGIDLIVAPTITDIAGPRIKTRQVADLPLLYVERPRFSVGGRIYKAVFDRCFALAFLVVFSPLLLATALAVRCTSRGPVLFRQQRVGLNGELFTLWKFRTMVREAPEQLATLAHTNEADGLLFKMRRDPRVTGVGRVLRRFSIDELPQLFHVLSGKMSPVGPRPPLPEEVARYDVDVHRRLLVKPGLTGLWQVSGRSELPWDEAVRLDLYYVDHWSPAMDIAILLKTLSAVVRGAGAY